MTFLIPEDDVQRMREEYALAHPTPAMLLVRHFKAHPGASISELAATSGFSKGWVRKTLRLAGIELPARKRRRPKVLASTPCDRCHHAKGGPRALSLHQESHCVGGWIHIPGHWSNPGSRYICESPHCIDGCDCPGFVAPKPDAQDASGHERGTD
jgi:hypothetical protein